MTLTDVVGWMLLHFVWQGALLGLLAAAALWLARRQSANVRHAIGCLSLLAMLAAPQITAVVLINPVSVRPRAVGVVDRIASGKGASDRGLDVESAFSLGRSFDRLNDVETSILPTIVWVWLAG